MITSSSVQLGDVFYMKICIRCGLNKPYEEYYKHKQMADGYLGRCKECHKSEIKRNRDENIDYYKAYDADRFKNDPKVKDRHNRYQKTQAYAESIAKSRKKFILENPEKRLAHNKVWAALRSGKLVKPKECSVCLCVKPSRQIHAHHDDYYAPLDVVWLCAKCHSEHHKSA